MGLRDDPFLIALSEHERELFSRAFLSLYRNARWERTTGRLLGKRKDTVVEGTVRSAAGHLASSFRDNLQQSPFHIAGSSHLRPSIKALLRAFKNVDPPEKRQKAVTPLLLRKLYASGRSKDDPHAVVADLVIGAFFFAMRSCEFSKTPRAGRTKCITLGDIVFRDSRKRHQSPVDSTLVVN